MEFAWDLQRLHSLALPSQRIPLHELAWHLELPYWRAADGRFFAVTPLDVIASPSRYREQFERTERADLDHPIHVHRCGDRSVILDGVHRLLKAHLTGCSTIAAHQVSARALSGCAVWESEALRPTVARW
jgi:hypothetical protein